jgi:hypothetical protein
MDRLTTLNLRAKVSSVSVSVHPSININDASKPNNNSSNGRSTQDHTVSSPGAGHVCQVCCAAAGAYCCPRCYVAYCGLRCFQNHNSDCTEEFAKERIQTVFRLEKQAKLEEEDETQVQQEIGPGNAVVHAQQFSQEQMETLSSLVGQCNISPDSNDGDSDDEIAQEIVEKDDNTQTRNVSKSTLMRATNIKLNPMWWEPAAESATSLATSDNTNVLTIKDMYARLIDSLTGSAHIKSLITPSPSAPSPELPFHLLALLYGYVITMRSYDNDYINRLPECVHTLTQMATPAFEKTFKPRSMLRTIESCVNHRPASMMTGSKMASRSAIKQTLSDVLSICEQAQCVLFVLIQVWMMVCCVLYEECDDDQLAAKVDTFEIDLDVMRLFCGIPSEETEKANLERIKQRFTNTHSLGSDEQDGPDGDNVPLFEDEQVSYIAASQAVPAIGQMIARYHAIFRSPMKPATKSSPSKSSDNNVSNVNKLVLEGVARKCYFLFLTLLNDLTITQIVRDDTRTKKPQTIVKALHGMLSAYIDECLS